MTEKTTSKALEKRRATSRKYIQKITDAANTITVKKPGKVNWNRREEAGKSLLSFLLTYYSDEFTCPFSDDHLEVIAALEQTGREGGKQCVLMARGSGKTSITARACLYFALYGIRKFLVMVAADESKASALLSIIRNDLSGNAKIIADFPEVCNIIKTAEGSRTRYKRIKYKGNVVGGEWGAEEITVNSLGLPWGNDGFTIVSKGITGNIRGLQHSLPDGRIVRPDLALLDDIQNLASKTEIDEREKLLVGAVGSLAGPLVQIATFVLLTCIKRGDLTERITESHPEFKVKKYKLVEAFPTDEEVLKLWERYDEIRVSSKAGATEFYKEHREQMDKGFLVRWAHRIRQGEISARETAWNLRAEHRLTFDCDFQNTPALHVVAGYDLTLEDVQEKRNGLKPLTVPELATVVYGLDINPSYGVSYVGLAGKTDGTYYLFDYGKYPGSGCLWTQEDKTQSEEQAIYKGILATIELLRKKTIRDEVGNQVSVTSFVVDIGYSKEAVFSAIATLKRQGVSINAIRGFGGQAYSPRSPLRKGDNWHLSKYGNSVAICLNGDVWRSRSQRGFLLLAGTPNGSISLNSFTEEGIKELAEHITAERITDTLISKEKGLTYYKWTTTGRNDLLDCLVYALCCLDSFGLTYSNQAGKPAKVKTDKPVDPVAQARQGHNRVTNPLATMKTGAGIGRGSTWATRF